MAEKLPEDPERHIRFTTRVLKLAAALRIPGAKGVLARRCNPFCT